VNPLKSSLKRTTAVLAGAVIGLTGVLAFAAPASAHHTTITGVTACTPSGDWTVTWTVANSEAHKIATIKDVVVSPTGGTVAGVAVDGQIPAGGQIVGTQNLSKNDGDATLKVFTKWLTQENGQPDNNPPSSWNWGSVARPGYCPTPAPATEATATSSPAPSASPAVPGTGGGEQPTLPKTGVPVGGIAGGAALLLAIGGGLLFMARRRRVKFTA
jgi:LPXTG-motif cell wall-anchored protein